jgi:hypothetical protein
LIIITASAGCAAMLMVAKVQAATRKWNDFRLSHSSHENFADQRRRRGLVPPLEPALGLVDLAWVELCADSNDSGVLG